MTAASGRAEAGQHRERWVTRALGITALVAFLLLVHNYGVNLLPYHRQIISPDLMTPDGTRPSFAYFHHFREGVPDRPQDMRSRVLVLEDGRRHTQRVANVATVRQVGGDMYAQTEDAVVFASSDNSDPRTNGRLYEIAWPAGYSRAMGRGSLLVLGASLAMLAWRGRRPASASAAPPAQPRRWWWAATLLVFLAGLYCNTGTRAPYAVTFVPYLDPATGHAYNQDHIHFKVMFDFVDGQPRAVWDHALFLRRILYPVLTWPAMKLLGFEAGGVVMNLLFSVAAFLGTAWWLEKRVGARGATMGAWLLAAYPGFAYWVGMPYQYAFIAPGALVLAIALHEIAARPSFRSTLGWSALMGVLYLAYDFAPIFLPATVGLLLWRRRWVESGTALVAGVLPLLLWLLLLRTIFGQALENSNSGIYRGVFAGLVSGGGWAMLLGRLPLMGDQAMACFFGANFIFLPAIFLGALCLNPATSRVRLADAELALLGATGLLFIGVNLAADQATGWNMSGTWVARVYQQVFPVMIFFVARWWQDLPPLPRGRRGLMLGGLVLATAGNLLVLFGPILGDPGRISGEAFYKFYTHADGVRLPAYENNLRTLPARTLGMGRPVTSQP